MMDQRRMWRTEGIVGLTCEPVMSTGMSSFSNGSGLPGFGPGWNRPKGPGPGQEPPSNLTRSVLAGLLPGLDINPPFFVRVEPGPQFHITVPTTFAPIKY